MIQMITRDRRHDWWNKEPLRCLINITWRCPSREILRAQKARTQTHRTICLFVYILFILLQYIKRSIRQSTNEVQNINITSCTSFGHARSCFLRMRVREMYRWWSSRTASQRNRPVRFSRLPVRKMVHDRTGENKWGNKDSPSKDSRYLCLNDLSVQRGVVEIANYLTGDRYVQQKLLLLRVAGSSVPCVYACTCLYVCRITGVTVWVLMIIIVRSSSWW